MVIATHSLAFRTSASLLLPSALCLLLFTFSCASAPPKKAPEWTRVPPAVLDAVCGKLKLEAMASDAPVTIVSTTQPLVSGGALRSIAHAYGKDAEVSVLAQLINSSLPSIPIDTADAHSCTWFPVRKLDPVVHHDVWVVELSSPFINPFTRGESGLFVRYSLGGHDSQWYWIPLAERNGTWSIGIVLATDMRE